MREIERLLPSAEMGVYGPAHEKPEDGGLYPLEEEGTYGKVPRRPHSGRWTGPQKYVKREKKTKMYASYAISDKCELHSIQLDRYDSRKKMRAKRTPSTQSLRATSAPPDFQKKEEVVETEEVPERGRSAPPDAPEVDVDELDMLSRLKLSKEVEEDTAQSLRSVLGEDQ